MNELPTYSGIYTYDEQYIEIDHGNAYRLTVYDSLMQARVAEQVVSSLENEVVSEFLTTALADKPIFAVTTDGRSDYAENRRRRTRRACCSGVWCCPLPMRVSLPEQHHGRSQSRT